MIFFTIFTSNCYLDLSELKKEHSKILLQVDNLEAANTDLHYQIYLLKNDLDYIEQVAREELNMVKPDEMVFKFVP